MTRMAIAAWAVMMTLVGSVDAHGVARFPQRPDIETAPQHVGFISGRLSPLAGKHFSGMGWKMFESFTIAAER